MIVNKPPMGWNSWNTFGREINQDLIIEIAEAMVSTGLRDCGYEYLVIDDCWSMRDRSPEGRLVADPQKFPNGMKFVADHVHSLGMKFGMYSCSGTLTCDGYPGSFEHEYIDAETFASWGVDFLKYDYCYHSDKIPPEDLYRRMGLALANCGRDILFSACSWGADKTNEWIKSTGAHMWRSTGDIFDNWESVKGLIAQQNQLFTTNGSGCFNDMDMLITGMRGKGNVGNLNGCSDIEYRTHFATWCMFGSPLIIGCDVRKLDDTTMNLLKNKELIRIDTDPAYRQVFTITPMGFADTFPNIYARYLENGDIALFIINAADGNNGVAFTIEDFGIPASSGKTVELTDVFTGKKIEEGYTPENVPVMFYNDTIKTNINPHDCVMLRAKVIDK